MDRRSLQCEGDRKATGSYNTPNYIVRYIVEQTAVPVLEQAIEGPKIDAERVQATLDVNVLDLARGSGYSLVESTEYIARFLVDAALGELAGTEDEPDLAY